MPVSGIGCSYGRGGVAGRSETDVKSHTIIDPMLWVVTDDAGYIQQIWPATASILGLSAHCTGYNLLLLLRHQHRRGALLDMEIAAIGWGSIRFALFHTRARQRLVIRYLVSRRPCTTPVLLNWTLDLIGAPVRGACYNQQRTGAPLAGQRRPRSRRFERWPQLTVRNDGPCRTGAGRRRHRGAENVTPVEPLPTRQAKGPTSRRRAPS